MRKLDSSEIQTFSNHSRFKRKDVDDVLPDTFNYITLQFTTGEDNLRSNSELSADVYKNDGTAIAAEASLHAQQDAGTWDNGTTSPRIGIDVVETKVPDLSRIDIVLRSHNDVFQGDDSWKVSRVLVQLSHSGAPEDETWTDLDRSNNQFTLSGRGGKSNVMRIFKDSLDHP